MMGSFFYAGNTIKLESGAQVESRLIDGAWIDLTLRSPDDDEQTVGLSKDEAFKVALALLRDVSLGRFGVG